MKNELSRLKIFLVFVFFAITKLTFSQSIYTNPITGANPSSNAPYTIGQTVATGITVSGLDLSGGVGNTNATDRFNADGWTTSANINTGDYFSWTITPGNCYDLDFTSLIIAYQRSGNGPQNLALRSSVDAYAANIWSTTAIPTTEQISTISLTAAAFQNLTTPITFRLYGWAAGNGNGTFSVNSFTFNGAVTSTNTAVAGTITGASSVCSGSNTTLTVGGNTGNIQWQTSTDNITFTNITGATSATYTTPNITATTYYRAGSTVGTCPTLYSSSYAVNITPPSMTAVNGTGCAPAAVNLSVNQVCQPAGSTTNWYAAATGGSSLGTGNTFTTPSLNATTTYYVANNFVTGNTTIGTNNATTDAAGLDFTVTSAMLLNSVQVSASGADNITVQLFTQGGVAIAGFPAITFPVVAGVNTLNLNWSLPVGTYRILLDILGASNLAVSGSPTFPFGLASFGSITGEVGTGTSYKYFYNWNISAPRIPVVATVNATVSNVTTSVCGSYTWAANGVTYNNSGVYYFVGPCNTATLNLTVTPITGTTNTVSACGSYTWSVNGQTYSTSSTYTHVVGCHTYTLALTVTPNTSSTTTASACDSYTWSADGQTYTSSGTYTFVSGCFTQTLELTITPSSSNTTTASSCGAYTWSVNGQTYNTSGTYTFLNGCQTEILILTVNTASFTAVNGEACGSSAINLGVNNVCPPAGSTTNWYAASTGGTSLGTGNTYTTPVLNSTTTYYSSLNFNAGATLSTGNRSTTNQRGLIFNAVVPILLNSVQINTNGAGSVTIELRNNLNQPVAGAAAVVFNATAGTNTVPLGWTIPAGTGYRIIKTAGTPQLSRTDPFTFPIGVNGILSITSSVDAGAVDNTRYFYFYNWNVSTPRIPVVATINTPAVPAFTQVAAICSGETLNALPTTSNNSITGTWSPALNNTATTTYTFTPTAGQCASTATMTITVNPITNNTTTASACDTYTWSVNGTTYTTSGTYTSVTGCNTETLVLTITESTTNTTVISACASYTWSVNGTTYTTSGTYTSVSGCTTEILDLTIVPNTSNTTVATGCDAYVWSVDGQQYTESGTYTYTVGCLTEILQLTITPSSTNTTVANSCGSYTWSVNGQQYTASGIYSHDTGCLTEILDLTITPSTNNTTTASACDTYTWSVNGTTYTTSGTYTSVTGCHTETLVLTITPSTNNTTTASACDTYTWSVNGTTYTTSGTYTSVTGCHTETLVLTITPSTNNTTTASACDTYTWSVNGTTYTASGTYTSVTGCHTETLNLTITPGTNNTTTASACDTYTWSVNGTTYTTSGTYTSVTGCHTETLVLTITPSTNNTTTASACDSYTWSVNGTTYTTSGTYTSVTGCHTETLVLTITPSTNNTTTASACDTYTWSVNGTTYTASGTYTSVTGCHTETLVLTVNTSSVYYVDADGDGFGSTTTGNFCSMPATGYSLNNSDCEDDESTTYPGAIELCNGEDDNCSGFADEGCPSTIAGEEPFNSLSAPSAMYSYCSSFYGTLAGAFPSTLAQSTCITGEDRWYNFTTLSTGITIFIGSNANDIVIELQDANGNVLDIENSVIGIGTEVLTRTGLTLGANYRVAVRNYNSNAQAGGQFSGCIRHLRAGGADSGTSATWPSTLSTCSLFKASYCGGTGVQYRYTWTGLTGTAAGLVFTKTQTSDYLNVTAVAPSLHTGSTYNVLVTAIYTIPNGAGVNEVFEMPATAPTTITISQAAAVALRSTDQLSNGPRYRGSIVASLPWVCGVTNWRWRFTEVNPLTLQTVGLPIEQNRGAASNYINLNTVTALQYGKTYAVQTAPVFTYTGTNYQWGPVTYMAIIGNAGMVIDASQGASHYSEKDAMQDVSQGATQGLPENLELNVYPNPSNGTNLNISVSGISSNNVQVKIYDAMGRKIQSERFVVDGTLQKELNFQQELSDGLYLIEVTTGTSTKSARLLIQR